MTWTSCVVDAMAAVVMVLGIMVVVLRKAVDVSSEGDRHFIWTKSQVVPCGQQCKWSLQHTAFGELQQPQRPC